MIETIIQAVAILLGLVLSIFLLPFLMFLVYPAGMILLLWYLFSQTNKKTSVLQIIALFFGVLLAAQGLPIVLGIFLILYGLNKNIFDEFASTCKCKKTKK